MANTLDNDYEMNRGVHQSNLPIEVMLSWDHFFNLMCAQMDRNGHKGFRDKWFHEPLELQMQTLQMSVAEVRTAMAYGIDVEDKLADVANWAAIIYDNYKNNLGSHVGGVPISE